MRNADVLQSGGFGTATSSARAGFLPICLDQAPREAFEGIAVYLRTAAKPTGGKAPAEQYSFSLYCAEHMVFTEQHRKRLVERGLRFVYIPITDHEKFRRQTEAQLLRMAGDPSIASSIKSKLIYETSVELMNELLAEPDLAAQSPRLENISRAVTMLVLNDPNSFSHLLAASSHDFYTATHMVNVGTWMVPLAFAMGHHDQEKLNLICQAGILHDIGKTFVAPEVLNKPGKLTDEDWKMLKSHPELGCSHLAKFQGVPPLIHTVTRQHHERLDGSGYPDGLKADQIDQISKICAVVDSFDAMTAFRPFKKKTMTVAEAMNILKKEAPEKYDPDVMAAWVNLLASAGDQQPATGGEAPKTTVAMAAAPAKQAPAKESDRRVLPRFPMNCPGQVQVLEFGPEGKRQRLGIPIIALNTSTSGAGFLSQTPIQAGEQVRLCLVAKGAEKKVSEGLIVRCRDYRDGWYEVGLRYAAEGEINAPAELMAG